VFRITGVLTVIGGWLITAGVAFTASFFVELAMYYGGIVVSAIIVVGAVYALIHSQRMYKKKQAEIKQGDVLFNEILACQDRKAIIPMLDRHVHVSTGEMILSFADSLRDTTDGLFTETLKPLRRASRTLSLGKRDLKNLRRRETICLQRAEPADAVRLSTRFHLIHNSMRQVLYGLIRINEPACEHVDNHFTPIAQEHGKRFIELRNRLVATMETAATNLRELRVGDNEPLRVELLNIREDFKKFRNEVLVELQGSGVNMTAATLLLHAIQETEQIILEVRHLLKRCRKFQELS
jgi:hypothetical protein